MAQFSLCRVVAQNAVVAWLVRTVARDAPGEVSSGCQLPASAADLGVLSAERRCALQAWAWAGVALLACLSGLNLFWFLKLLAVARALPAPNASYAVPAAATGDPGGEASCQEDEAAGLPVSMNALNLRATASSICSRPGTQDILVDCRGPFAAGEHPPAITAVLACCCMVIG